MLQLTLLFSLLGMRHRKKGGKTKSQKFKKKVREKEIQNKSGTQTSRNQKRRRLLLAAQRVAVQAGGQAGS